MGILCNWTRKGSGRWRWWGSQKFGSATGIEQKQKCHSANFINIQTLLRLILRYNRLRWFGHVVRNDGCINSITEFEVVGQRGRGRPKKTWKDTINNDLRHWKLSRADPLTEWSGERNSEQT